MMMMMIFFFLLLLVTGILLRICSEQHPDSLWPAQLTSFFLLNVALAVVDEATQGRLAWIRWKQHPISPFLICLLGISRLRRFDVLTTGEVTFCQKALKFAPQGTRWLRKEGGGGRVLPGDPGVVPTASWRSERVAEDSILLLMAEIRRSPVEVGSLSHCLQGFIHPWWCRIASINNKNQFQFWDTEIVVIFVHGTLESSIYVVGAVNILSHKLLGAAWHEDSRLTKTETKEYVKRWKEYVPSMKNDHFIDKMVEPH